ncbi:hypothetical protein C5167_022531 [Papaver somniferum]|uniref:ZF-HD dimerization-type domain-containing protein n=1 Tax=Papaver somniferum TaxID=3469 RepID=A0A4Y7JM18_PAPSO|nr:zinc-finger homeodomain protein 11-like [Papaver somniferum]RZC60789.1 hypothetical protein C5167_022531 [Papaver somniferum]
MDSAIKTPPSDTEVVITTPPPTKSFTNGVLKRHHHHQPQPTSAAIVVYRECLKNHAASLGGRSLDGCGEFMPSPNTNLSDPTSLKCAACNCHRNFHRRDPEEGTHIIEYRHHQAPPVLPIPQQQQPGDQEGGNVSPSSSDSPPPISSAYNYPNSSAPHMLLALRTGGLPGVPSDNNHQMMMAGGKMSTTTTTTIGGLTSPNTNGNVSNGSGRKRIRTKFSQEQKDKMYLFSERLGWKLQKRDEGIIDEFCNEIGVERGILKVWMHNNKHTFGKIRDSSTTPSTITTTSAPHVTSLNNNNNNHHQNHHPHQNQPQNQNHHYNNGGGGGGVGSGGGSVLHHNHHHEVQVTANCSSSSS